MRKWIVAAAVATSVRRLCRNRLGEVPAGYGVQLPLDVERQAVVRSPVVRYVALAAVLTGLAGCAAQVQGNEHSVIVVSGDFTSDTESFLEAEKHCRKYGKVARVVVVAQSRAGYDCVPAR